MIAFRRRRGRSSRFLERSLLMAEMRLVYRVLVAVILWLVFAVPLHAQAPARDGFFIGFGFGWGSLGGEDVDERESSAVAYLKLGGALNDQLLLGAESNGWYKEESGVTITLSNLSGVAYFYPRPGWGLFLKGGLGIARLEVEISGFGSGDDDGLGVILGGGYDIGFGGRFGLTPFANYIHSSFDGGSTNVLQIGVGANWY
jgi:hypothetical protein